MPGALVPSTCNGSTSCLLSPFLSSQPHTCTSSCLLNIATQGLSKPADSTCSSQTHILHAPNLVSSSEQGHQPPSWASLEVTPPGSHPDFSLTLTPDVTNFTSEICSICPFFSISPVANLAHFTQHPASPRLLPVSFLVSHTYPPIYSPLFKTQI